MESYLCDISTLVSMCSELTYNKEVVELLDDKQKLVRRPQIQEELQHPGKLSAFFSRVLERDVYVSLEDILSFERILATFGGEKETQRYNQIKLRNLKCLLEGETEGLTYISANKKRVNKLTSEKISAVLHESRSLHKV